MRLSRSPIIRSALLAPITALGLAFTPAQAGDADAVTLFQLGLDELLQVDTSTAVATRLPLSARKTPASITVITASDIEAMGARDLIDVLQRVPGLSIAKDIDVSGLVVRGMFGFEGRALFLLDGLQLSELSFGAYALGNELPVHLIDRIEVIRGPGSVLYGGTAETAVINIISKTDGTELRARYGALPDASGHQDVGLRFGAGAGDWHWRGFVFGADARRSDGDYRYFNERPVFPHNEASADIDSSSVLAELGWREDWTVKLFWQQYENAIVKGFAVDPTLPPDEQQTAIDTGIAANSSPLHFDNGVLDLGYRLADSEQFRSELQLGWQYNVPFDRPRRDDLRIDRYKLTNNNQWLWPADQVLLGFELWQDTAHILRSGDPADRDPALRLRANPTDAGGESVTLYQSSVFASWQHDWQQLQFFAGGRYDYSEAYGDAFSPRVGLTHAGPSLHWKLFAQQAFRAPLISNNAFSRFGYDPTKPHREPVTPESVMVYEFELGYLLSSAWFLVGNIYYQTLEDVIEFRYNAAADDLYSDNGGRYGSQGIEIEARYQQGAWRFVGNVSWSEPLLYPDVNPYAYASEPMGGDTYLALHSPQERIGVPDTKLYANLAHQFSDRWSGFVNLLWLAEQNAAVDQPFGVTGTLPSQWLVDMGLRYGLANWSVGLTVHDLANERQQLVTPYYDSTFDTLPYKGREVSIDLGFLF